MYDLRFKADNKWVPLCSKSISREDSRVLREAVRRSFVWEFQYDNLPVWGYIGRTAVVEAEVDGVAVNVTRTYLFRHVDFHVLYNNDQVIQITATPDQSDAADISADRPYDIEFSYGVEWKETDIPWERRLEVFTHTAHYARDKDFQWFSIINSFVLVLLLSTLVVLIMAKVLRKDLERYLQLEGLDEESAVDAATSETGWKLLHGDVFRPPSYPGLLAACLGVGVQFLTTIGILLVVALWGTFYPISSRGALESAFVILYALTAGLAGFTAATFYRKLGGTGWTYNALLTCVLFFGPLFIVFAVLNSIAIHFNSMSALPAGTIAVFGVLWVFLTVPLTILGAIVGKNTAGPLEAPGRVKSVPRQIPELPWFAHPGLQLFCGGFLPFSAVFIELFYLVDSIWGNKLYTLFIILFLTFLILLIVVSCLTVTLVYFQLNSEDHRWMWRSFLIGAAPSVFFYAYTCHYYSRSAMDGTLQAAFFFGYNLVGCYAFSLLLGSIGFFSALLFVKVIFNSVKSE